MKETIGGRRSARASLGVDGQLADFQFPHYKQRWVFLLYPIPLGRVGKIIIGPVTNKVTVTRRVLLIERRGNTHPLQGMG